MLVPILYLAASIGPIEATMPARQPQLAAAHGVVAMTFGAGSNIYYSSSADHGRTWNAPVKVAENGALALGRHRGPRVTILENSIVITAVVGERKSADAHAHGLPEAGNLITWRSLDRGKTWARAGVINDTPGAAREGLHAIAAAADGSLTAVWLDLRAKGTQLYSSRSTDGGATWAKNVAVYTSPNGTICQCCHPSLAVDASGSIWAMWRNMIDGSRDLYVSSTTDGAHWSEARKLGEGTWKLNACPMDGGGLVIESGRITSAWRRDGDIFLTESGSSTERRIATGKDVALARNSRHKTYLVWTKDGGIQALTPKSGEPVALATEGGFATLVTLDDGAVLAAWEAHDSIETKRLE